MARRPRRSRPQRRCELEKRFNAHSAVVTKDGNFLLIDPSQANNRASSKRRGSVFNPRPQKWAENGLIPAHLTLKLSPMYWVCSQTSGRWRRESESIQNRKQLKVLTDCVITSVATI